MKNYKIVVARYNENIDWTNNYPECVVYNKGSDYDGVYIPLKNFGREAHTYLHHIVNNYDNLSDYTFFVQGNPFDHSSNLIDDINNLISNGFEDDFYWISDRVVESDFEYKREPYFVMFTQLKKAYKFVFGENPKIEIFKFGAGAQFCVSKKLVLSRPLSFYQRLYDFFDNETLNDIDDNYVKLLRYPDIDQNIMNIDRSNPEMAHYMERFWGLIFNGV